MHILLETRSLSWAESVRLALLAQGIDAVILDQASPATLGLAGSIRLAVLDDGDLARANEIVAALQPAKTAPLASWWWHKRALLAFVAGLVLASFAMSASDTPSMRSVTSLLIASTIMCLAGAVVLVVLGYRADQRASEASADQREDVETT